MPIGFLIAALLSAGVGSLFATSDAALASLPEARLQALLRGGTANAAPFERYARDRARVRSRWLVGRVIAVALAAVLVDDVTEREGFARLGPVVAVLAAIVTYGVLTEILGTLARRRPEQMGALALRYLQPLEWVLAPLAEPLTMLGRAIDKRFPPRGLEGIRVTQTEVEWVVTEGERLGDIANEPAELIRNVLDFTDLTAKDFMVPRRRITGVEVHTSLEHVLEVISTDEHSRYPIYRETLDNIVGLLHAKDLLRVAHAGTLATTTVSDLSRGPVLFVVETQSAASCLRELHARGLHMAVVSDEFGGTSGIVTLEDIVEEIVGKMPSKLADEDEPQIEEIGEGRFVANAAISLSRLSARTGRSFPHDGDFESLGGLLVHRAGRVPEAGTVLELDGVRCTVREADETHVVSVEIDALEPARPSAAACT